MMEDVKNGVKGVIYLDTIYTNWNPIKREECILT